MTSSEQQASTADVTAADLATFDEDYEGAPIEDSEFEPLPDGKYRAAVERVELARTRNGRPMLKWGLRVLEGEHAGRMLFRNNVLVSADNLRWLKRDLHVCGLTLAKLSELPNRLNELLDLALEVTVRTRGENTNVYLNKRIEAAPTPEASAGSASSALPPF